MITLPVTLSLHGDPPFSLLLTFQTGDPPTYHVDLLSFRPDPITYLEPGIIYAGEAHLERIYDLDGQPHYQLRRITLPWVTFAKV